LSVVSCVEGMEHGVWHFALRVLRFPLQLTTDYGPLTEANSLP